MNLLTKIRNWGDHHHPKWLDYFRIVLGLILMWKGIAFITHLDAFSRLMNETNLIGAASISLVAHIIIVLHIIGGFLIVIGSHTRMSCLLNLPVLLVAVFFVNLRDEILRPYSEIWLSAFVLLGLICFLVQGDGKISIEYNKKIAA
jgi:putative oxidoreductase